MENPLKSNEIQLNPELLSWVLLVEGGSPSPPPSFYLQSFPAELAKLPYEKASSRTNPAVVLSKTVSNIEKSRESKKTWSLKG